MKTIIFLIATSCLPPVICASHGNSTMNAGKNLDRLSKSSYQSSGYGYFYAYNEAEKTIYISYPLLLSDFDDCTGNGGYISSVTDCISTRGKNALTNKEGALAKEYSQKSIVWKNSYANYNEDGYYSKSEIENLIQNLLTTYRGKGFTVLRLYLN